MELVRDGAKTDLPSLEQLTTEQARTLRLLSVHPGQQIGVHATAALCDITLETARLESLVKNGLLGREENDRFSIPETTRHYLASIATELSDSELAIARTNLITWYADACHQVDKLIYPLRVGAYFDEFAKNENPAIVPFTDRASAHAWAATEFDVIPLLQNLAAELKMYEQVIAFATLVRIAQFLPSSFWPIRVKTESEGIVATQKLGNRKLESFLLGRRSISYRELNKLDLATKDARAALEIADSMNDLDCKASALFGLGNRLIDQLELVEAEQCFQQALEISLAHDMRFGIALSYCNLGRIAAARGDHQQALKYAQLDLTIRRELAIDPFEGYPLFNIAKAWHELGDYRKAIEFGKQSLAVYKKLPGGERYIARTLKALATFQKQSDLMEEAEESLSRAAEIYAQLGINPDEG